MTAGGAMSGERNQMPVAACEPHLAPPLIQMRGIVKVYPPNVLALDDVTVNFADGEIHALVGENGAGKSTLMKVLYGLVHHDQGEIHYRGRTVRFRSAGEAIAAGIGMVHQEILLVNEYTVWENIVLGAEPVDRLGRIDKKRARNEVQAIIDRFHFALDPDAVVANISVAARQKVEILKLLYRNVSVLILDEPTAVLTPQEIPQLFAELRALRDEGHTILFISHRLEEVLELAERVTVLRKGRVVATLPTAQTTRRELAALMVGREVLFSSRRTPQPPGDVVFAVEELCYEDEHGRIRLQDIHLHVRAGELVGVAGVEGNGQLELVHVITGLLQPTAGRIRVAGVDLTQASILERRRYIAYVPQDRGRMGSSLAASVVENAIMTHHRLNPRLTHWRGVLLDWRRAHHFTQHLAQRFNVSMPGHSAPLRALSGGNQQKVILGRELLLECPFILLDQPTRGLDVGSIEYVHDQMLAMRRAGRSLLMISANLEEIFLLADRIVVLHRGEIVVDLPAEQATVEQVGRYMLEGKG
ncbi:ABC transporter ATP-binding protein [Caldilinea aerophila]|uniref:Putative ABC transporter ATP-binding protein n=1 Tax=Caldilinea aerophila (strain DSM 14535 / JCM 11387 / NBRC 104270 / STL-6-O1) TaxID=926550 RepID=I0I2V7_CALAS|nr:ABC transporter ATP-binding protein [Caldilinea aerophila]BAL99594.1 putative ABC transporter ATP-binding protein [Caldilinea aerophila DSM 14535 = NBRC 104270]